MFEALFSIEIAAKCKEIAFSASSNHAVARVLGSPQGPKKAQKACFGAILCRFEHFWPLFRLRRAPAPTKLKNSRRETQKEPPAAPEAKTAPQEARNEPPKARKRASKEAQKGIDLGGPLASFSWRLGVPFRLPDVVVLVLVVVSCGARCSACWSVALLSVAVVVVLVLLGCWFCVPAFGCS